MKKRTPKRFAAKVSTNKKNDITKSFMISVTTILKNGNEENKMMKLVEKGEEKTQL